MIDPGKSVLSYVPHASLV